MHATRIAGFASLPERVRAFIALRLDATVEQAIAALIDRLRTPESGDQESGIRWIRSTNFHLTLFFLGPAVPRERLVPIAQALDAIAEATAPFAVPRVAWAPFRIWRVRESFGSVLRVANCPRWQRAWRTRPRDAALRRRAVPIRRISRSAACVRCDRRSGLESRSATPRI
jgi:hypothetical protein